MWCQVFHLDTDIKDIAKLVLNSNPEFTITPGRPGEYFASNEEGESYCFIATGRGIVTNGFSKYIWQTLKENRIPSHIHRNVTLTCPPTTVPENLEELYPAENIFSE